MDRRLTLVSMSGLRVGHDALHDIGMRMPGLVRRAEALSHLPPLGLLTVAAMVPESWQVDLVLDNGASSVSDAANRILEGQPSIVAFSALTPSINRAATISCQLQKKGVITVVGGLHATADPGFCQQHFDVVVCGDGEPMMPRMLADAVKGSLKSRYQVTDPFDLSQAPLPRWELLGTHRPPRYTLQTMRGCPWNCSFCAASRLLGPARIKPDHLIGQELAAIRDLKDRPWLELADDNTFAADRDFETLLSLLRDAGVRWFTESDWRIGLRPELLSKIAASGCRQILVGFESQVFRYSGMGGKTAEWYQMLEAAEAMQEAGIVVNACFIVGADGESQASIERLGDFLEQAPFGEIQVTLQTPFPGTSLYSRLKKENRLLDKDYSHYTLFDVVYQPESMTVDELQKGFDRLIERVFGRANQKRRDQIQKEIRRKRRAATAVWARSSVDVE